MMQDLSALGSKMNEPCLDTEATQLTLSGELTIYSVHELRELLLRAIDENRDIDVDMSEVSEVDTAGLQLVLLARREVEARGQQLRISGCDSEVREALAFYNLA